MSLVGPGGKTNNPVIATVRRNFMYATTNLASTLICASHERRRALFAAVAAPVAAGNPTEFQEGMHLPGTERTLAKNQLLVLPDAATTLVCMEGELWLTRDGDIEDYILGPGKCFAARAGDRVTVQALRPSRLRLDAA
jgi:hypothetical protein